MIISKGTKIEMEGDGLSYGAALVDGANGKLAIYYGGADTVTYPVFGMHSDVVELNKSDSCLIFLWVKIKEQI